MPSSMTISRLQKFAEKNSSLTDTTEDIHLLTSESNVKRLNNKNLESDEEDTLLRVINF